MVKILDRTATRALGDVSMSHKLPASLPLLIQRVLDIKASRLDNVVDSTLSLRQFLGTLVHQDSYQQGHYHYQARRTSGKGVLRTAGTCTAEIGDHQAPLCPAS